MKLAPCNHRHALEGQPALFRCTHPRIVADNAQVTVEVCRVFRERDREIVPPRRRSPLPTIRPGRRPRTVAVVIPCHNYARYLPDALDSVLAQTRRPQEIVVVDDASTDETATVAGAYAPFGVRYLRVEERHSQRARLAGYRATQAEVLVFLDADDALAEDYLECGMAQFDDAGVGIVYSDVQQFDGATRTIAYPAAFDRAALARTNFMHSGCLVRREAIEQSRAFEAANDDRLSPQDWLLWRRIVAVGWHVRKQPGLYLYRRHSESLSQLRKRLPSAGYFERASLALETVTLFIPLAGRTRLWPALAAFLRRQEWPHEQTRLWLHDTSQDPHFSGRVRRWLTRCGYPDVRHSTEAVGERGLADRPRVEACREVSVAMARIYNRLAREQTTAYVWIVEDDVVPPDNACKRLLRGFDENTASVSGVYRSRLGEHYVAWDGESRFVRRGAGVQTVTGNGFGCVVLRGGLLGETVFTAAIDRTSFDTAFYHRLPRTGLTAKVDWSVECEHHTVAEFARIPASEATPNP